MSRKRSDVAIMAEILRLIRRGEKAAGIMYGANINHAMYARYISLLEERGFVSLAGDEMEVTAAGQSLLLDLQKIAEHFPSTARRMRHAGGQRL
jgi:predicted transcriptional regulator